MPDPLLPNDNTPDDDIPDDLDGVDFGSMSFGSGDDAGPVGIPGDGGVTPGPDETQIFPAQPGGVPPVDVTPTMGIEQPPGVVAPGTTVMAGVDPVVPIVPPTDLELTTSQAVQDRRALIGVGLGLLVVAAVIIAIILGSGGDDETTTPTTVGSTIAAPETTVETGEIVATTAGPSTSPTTTPSTVPATSAETTTVPTTVAPTTTLEATTTTLPATTTTPAPTTTLAATTTTLPPTTTTLPPTTTTRPPPTDAELDALVPSDALGLTEAGFTLAERSIEPTGFSNMQCDPDGDFASIAAPSFIVERFTRDTTSAIVYSFIADADDKAAFHRGIVNLGECQGAPETVSTGTSNGVTTTQARPEPDFALIAVTGPGDIARTIEIEGDGADESFDEVLALAQATARG